jgi:two-component system sporulation sensor kinase A
MILRKPFYPDELRLLILRLAGGRARGGAGHDQAEARLSSFGRVARSLAHQINNPLTAISGWLQVLAEDPRSPASSRGTLDIIRDEAGKIRAVVDRLLLLAGQKILAPEPVDLNAVVCQAVSDTERRLPNGGPRIAMRLEPNAPAVLGDPGQLQQAVSGILARLTAPCPKGSVMRVETTHAAGRVTLVFRAPPGTAPRLQEGTLFAPFADEGEDPAAFDLALCRRVIENHGGSVHVCAEGQPSVRLALPTGGPETET